MKLIFSRPSRLNTHPLIPQINFALGGRKTGSCALTVCGANIAVGNIKLHPLLVLLLVGRLPGSPFTALLTQLLVR